MNEDKEKYFLGLDREREKLAQREIDLESSFATKRIKWFYDYTKRFIIGETSSHITYVVRILEDGLKALAYIPNIMEDENPISVLGFINSYDHSDATNACEWHLSEFEGGLCVDMLKAKIEEKEAQAKEIGDCLTYLRSRLEITITAGQEQ